MAATLRAAREGGSGSGAAALPDAPRLRGDVPRGAHQVHDGRVGRREREHVAPEPLVERGVPLHLEVRAVARHRLRHRRRRGELADDGRGQEVRRERAGARARGGDRAPAAPPAVPRAAAVEGAVRAQVEAEAVEQQERDRGGVRGVQGDRGQRDHLRARRFVPVGNGHRRAGDGQLCGELSYVVREVSGEQLGINGDCERGAGRGRGGGDGAVGRRDEKVAFEDHENVRRHVRVTEDLHVNQRGTRSIQLQRDNRLRDVELLT